MPHHNAPVSAPDDRASDREERRAYIRHESGVWTCCQRAPGRLDSAGWPAVVQDLSAGGAALVVGCPLVPGTVLEFHLTDECGGTTRLLASVVHLTTQPACRWLVGCAFLAPLTEAQVAALLRGRLTAGCPARGR
jgi:hypothetical protein